MSSASTLLLTCTSVSVAEIQVMVWLSSRPFLRMTMRFSPPLWKHRTSASECLVFKSLIFRLCRTSRAAKMSKRFHPVRVLRNVRSSSEGLEVSSKLTECGYRRLESSTLLNRAFSFGRSYASSILDLYCGTLYDLEISSEYWPSFPICSVKSILSGTKNGSSLEGCVDSKQTTFDPASIWSAEIHLRS